MHDLRVLSTGHSLDTSVVTGTLIGWIAKQRQAISVTRELSACNSTHIGSVKISAGIHRKGDSRDGGERGFVVNKELVRLPEKNNLQS